MQEVRQCHIRSPLTKLLNLQVREEAEYSGEMSVRKLIKRTLRDSFMGVLGTV